MSEYAQRRMDEIEAEHYDAYVAMGQVQLTDVPDAVEGSGE